MLKEKLRVGSRAYATSASTASLSFKARPYAEAINANWYGLRTDGGSTKNYIGGEFLGVSAPHSFLRIDRLSAFRK